jgi:hypothetical protein
LPEVSRAACGILVIYRAPALVLTANECAHGKFPISCSEGRTYLGEGGIQATNRALASRTRVKAGTTWFAL